MSTSVRESRHVRQIRTQAEAAGSDKPAGSGPSPSVMGTYARQNVVFEQAARAPGSSPPTASATSILPAALPSTRSAMPIRS